MKNECYPQAMDDFVLIPLTRGYSAIVDACDAERISRYKWKAQKNSKNKTAYASRTLPKENGKRATQMMHRLVLGLTDANIHVDHIDGNGLNNRRSNLRICNRAENMWNSSAHKDGRVPLKGVYINDRLVKKYCASIRANGKIKYLGAFASPDLANKAYLNAAKRLHGEFAKG